MPPRPARTASRGAILPALAAALASCMAVPAHVDRVDALPPLELATRQRPSRQPVARAPLPPRPQGPPQTILLHAKDATVHGKDARYEVGKDRDNIGFWFSESDYVTWECSPRTPASFLVQVVYACPESDAGSDYAVCVGEHELVDTVEATGGWGKFVTRRVGVVELAEPGPYSVAVRYEAKRSHALMNLQAVVLRSGQWEKGLQAWWPFSEGSGTETLEMVSGQPTPVRFARWTRGVGEGALRFNGFSSQVTLEAARVPDLSEGFTIEAWVRPASQPKGWCPIVNRQDYPLGFFFGFDGAGDLGLHLGTGGKWQACTTREPLPLGRWTHLAATFDAQAGIAVYVDGRLRNRLVTYGPMRPARDQDLVIGRHNRHPWVFDGVIDEVRLLSRPLSPTEMRTRYTRSKAAIESPPPIAIAAVRPDHRAARVFERVTLEVDLEATYDNPFDVRDVRLDAEVTGPSGDAWAVPGFLYQPFFRTRDDADEQREVLVADGEPRWQVRLAFAEPGTYTVRLTAADRTGSASAEPLTIGVEGANVAGMVRCHPTDTRYFATDRGETFFPIGANVCWGLGPGTYNYDLWLPRYAHSGCNYFRVWLSPFWATCAMNTEYSGFDAIDLANAWRFDHVLETAERLGLRVMPCIDSFNILRSQERPPGVYEQAPYARENGGPLDVPADYFTNPYTRQAIRNRLRYLVARYGYSSALFAWELWNEVDIIDGYDSSTVAAWHAEMAATLRRMDPWNHLRTTSFAHTQGDPVVDALPQLDFVQTHSYGAKDMAEELGKHRREKEAARTRPHFHGEFGIADARKTTETDPTGVHLHNALFASVGQQQAGTPMTWWWDNYIHPQNLYPVFAAFAAWVEGFDFAAQEARPAEVRVLASDLRLREPTVLVPVKGSWEKADFNRPITAEVDRQGNLIAPAPISELLHGLGHHKDKHNPVTFRLQVPRPCTFGVEVRGVSGYGSGHLEVRVDGRLALEVPCPVADDEERSVVHDYDGLTTVPLPEGEHTVEVKNTGKDWISVASYRIPWLSSVRVVAEPLRVYGLTGRTEALLWVQNKLYTWPQATAKGFQPRPVRDARLQVEGLAPGSWTVEQWDTQRAGVFATERATVGLDGRLEIELPDIVWDAAYRLRLEAPASFLGLGGPPSSTSRAAGLGYRTP
ncbi:MAG: LamG-like jellyroll fold domain-containing protein [Candidatus Brocadiia bacterium]